VTGRRKRRARTFACLAFAATTTLFAPFAAGNWPDVPVFLPAWRLMRQDGVAGDVMRVDFVDDGPGMPPEVLARPRGASCR
jgi:hypothetical protein